MTRTEAIAQALDEELRAMRDQVNGWTHLRSITYDVKLKSGTSAVRAVVTRPEFERVLVNGHDNF